MKHASPLEDPQQITQVLPFNAAFLDHPEAEALQGMPFVSQRSETPKITQLRNLLLKAGGASALFVGWTPNTQWPEIDREIFLDPETTDQLPYSAKYELRRSIHAIDLTDEDILAKSMRFAWRASSLHFPLETILDTKFCAALTADVCLFFSCGEKRLTLETVSPIIAGGQEVLRRHLADGDAAARNAYLLPYTALHEHRGSRHASLASQARRADQVRALVKRFIPQGCEVLAPIDSRTTRLAST